MPKSDRFSTSNQVNARLLGKYHSIATNLDKCVFCDLRDKYVVTKTSGWVLTANIFPYINGQLLILPERHLENFRELSPKDIITSHDLIIKGTKLLKRKLNIKNYWLVMRQGEAAGKTVKHLHWNIMPYVEGLNTWHYQAITVEPMSLAKILRKALEDERT